MAGSWPTSSSDRVTAVVVNYNAAGALERCVESLAADGVAHVVVVDNASTDHSADELSPRAGNTRVEIVRSTSNLGYGRAANVGATRSGSEYVLVANPDLEVRPGCIEVLAGVLSSSPGVALVGPMLRETSGVVYPSGRDFPSIAEALGHAFLGLVWGGNPWTRRYRHLGHDQHVSRSADWVSGAIFLVRRRAFESVGGFDEGYFMYLEEVDLCWRLRRAGWEVRYEPAAEVVHVQGVSTSQHPYRMLLAHHRSMWRFARKTASARDRWLLPLIAVGLVVRLGLAWLEHLVQPRRLLGREG